MTVSEMRRKQLERFNEEYIGDIEAARHIANCYYKLCGMCDRLLTLENDARCYKAKMTRRLAQKTDAAIERLNKKLSDYGLELTWSGHIPGIGKTNEKHCITCLAFYLISY